MKRMSFAIPDRKRIFEIIEIGEPDDHVSRIYDIFNMLSIGVNLLVSILFTFEEIQAHWSGTLLFIEGVTVAFFAMDFLLRILTAGYLYPKRSPVGAIWAYLTSFKGLVDLMSFLPYYLPVFFPSGAAAFRLFRVMRFFRLFRINAYYDSFNIIAEVLNSRRQQLLSSVFMILILMTGASLCMYSLEHEAQPEVFTNAFSGLWWAVSAMLTIGYGDVYPVTALGQAVGIVLTILGVGMVAIPTGIISAGFVDQYSRIKRLSEYAKERDIHFIKVHLVERDRWSGRAVKDLGLPVGVLIAAIQRDGQTLVPRGNVVLEPGDTLVLGAESFDEDKQIDLKEVVLRKQNDWNGQRIRDLDISRQTLIIMVKRGNRSMIPHGNLVLQEGDKIILYTQKKSISHSNSIQI